MTEPNHCDVYGGVHEPRPERFVTHHVLPQVCGGQTTPDNLVRCCDDCHYDVHALMYALKRANGDPEAAWQGEGPRGAREYALRGYQAAVAAGTVDKIPNEGGSVLP